METKTKKDLHPSTRYIFGNAWPDPYGRALLLLLKKKYGELPPEIQERRSLTHIDMLIIGITHHVSLARLPSSFAATEAVLCFVRNKTIEAKHKLFGVLLNLRSSKLPLFLYYYIKIGNKQGRTQVTHTIEGLENDTAIHERNYICRLFLDIKICLSKLKARSRYVMSVWREEEVSN